MLNMSLAQCNEERLRIGLYLLYNVNGVINDLEQQNKRMASKRRRYPNR